MQTADTNTLTIIRLPELLKKLGGVHRETVRRWELNNGFPLRIKMGHRSIGWSLAAVDEWLLKRANKT